ncbi:hypothetical protein IFM89_034150 [Coptis chinensis]|uniref:Uncharacterized protein n=1 Tax=Coptis chinensis TaxID=261450 RepID=A0A835HYX2_9MAGN|nr:hypothetical protein IFM89_034150 [Coptis chinensis]
MLLLIPPELTNLLASKVPLNISFLCYNSATTLPTYQYCPYLRHPKAFLYKNLLTDAECDHLISLAKGKLQKSTVVDNENGTSVPSDIRTSSGCFLYNEDLGLVYKSDVNLQRSKIVVAF